MNSKKGFAINLEKETLKNKWFRRVLYTGENSQLVLMCLQPREEIGAEIHKEHDQFFRFEKGVGVVEINHVKHRVRDGSGVIVPAGALHNVTNTSKRLPLKLYTIYSPPEHKDGTVHHTKAAAMRQEEHFDRRTTE